MSHTSINNTLLNCHENITPKTQWWCAIGSEQVVPFCAALLFLSVNHFVEVTPDEVSQIGQWYAIATRGVVALTILSICAAININAVRSIQTAIITAGGVEAVIALLQVYGFSISRNTQFSLTGTFYNPGPLGGYIAVCLPVCLSLALEKSALHFRHIAFALFAVMLIVFPSTMSRTAWIATTVGLSYVTTSQPSVKVLIVNFFHRYRWCMFIVVGLTIIVAIGLWKLKSTSASGRLFLWKMSTLTITEAPLTGHGTFAVPFASTQEKYFAVGGEDWEIDVASCPDYAFNEYLESCVRIGVPATTAIVILVGYIMFIGHKRKRTGAVGGLLALLVFALASYPFHIPAFVAQFILLLTVCLWQNKTSQMLLIFGLLICSSIFAYNIQTLAKRKEAMEDWQKALGPYYFKIYDKAAINYATLYERLSWNSTFLYEYGHSLSKNGDYAKSNTILTEANNIANDAMILNILGKNNQALGNYVEAEYYFRKSTNRLPNRMYPHYLLLQLYSIPDYKNLTKMQEEAQYILTMPVKVESSATKEMQTEARQIIYETD